MKDAKDVYTNVRQTAEEDITNTIRAAASDNEKIDIAAARILELYRPAFEALAK